MTFAKEAIDAVGGDWADVQQLNEVLERLKGSRRQSIEPGGDFENSKVAWKIGSFCQAILYRVVMLAEGCSAMWNARNILGAMLCARATMETTALIVDFAAQLERFCNAGDLTSIDNLVMNRIFSTRLEGWVEQAPGTQATNILGHIDKLDKLINGVREHYDVLSEFCHPNTLGHRMLFETLDQSTATVTLSETLCFRLDMLEHITAAYFMLHVAENRLSEIDGLLPKVVQLSEASRL